MGARETLAIVCNQPPFTEIFDSESVLWTMPCVTIVVHFRIGHYFPTRIEWSKLCGKESPRRRRIVRPFSDLTIALLPIELVGYPILISYCTCEFFLYFVFG